MLVTGTAVGVILPCMPMLVHQLGISQAEFGTVISGFGLAKLIANVPASMLVDKYGRRSMMVGGLGVVSLSFVGVGLCTTFEELVLARFLAGFGVSSLIAGATMAVTDMSTPLNRARMMAPVMTAFSAGSVVGPGVGGLLADSVGVSTTFFCVGGIFLMNMAWTRFFTQETLHAFPHADQGGQGAAQRDGTQGKTSVTGSKNRLQDQVNAMFAEWRLLLQNDELCHTFLLNGMYVLQN